MRIFRDTTFGNNLPGLCCSLVVVVGWCFRWLANWWNTPILNAYFTDSDGWMERNNVLIEGWILPLLISEYFVVVATGATAAAYSVQIGCVYFCSLQMQSWTRVFEPLQVFPSSAFLSMQLNSGIIFPFTGGYRLFKWFLHLNSNNSGHF